MEDVKQWIKQSKDYQVQMCAEHMNELFKSATDNLTGGIAFKINAMCMQEIADRKERKIAQKEDASNQY
jgi:hypothetical protein